jgi:hypothetical protein
MSRRRPPLALQLEVALRQLGLDPPHVRLDHHPPLEQRHKRFCALTGRDIYEPAENDPRYMQWLSTEVHAVKTTGRRGTSKLSKRGGDLSEIAKTKRLERKRVDLPTPKPRRSWPKRKIPSRPIRQPVHLRAPR